MRRPVLALLLALVVATAGCNSLVSDGPSPDATRTTEPLSGNLAPGLSASGVTDAWALAANHSRILQEDSFTSRGKYVARYRNGTVLRYLKSTYRVGKRSDHYRSVSRFGGQRSMFFDNATGRVERWSNGNQTLGLVATHGTTRYTRYDEPRPRVFGTSQERLFTLFSSMNATRVERATTNASGPPRYRVTASRVARPATLASTTGMRAFDTVRNATLVAVVDSWGIVHSYRLEFVGVRGNETLRVVETRRYSAIGTTTASRPPWYGEAVESTTREGG